MQHLGIHHRTWSSGLGICLLVAAALVLASCGSDRHNGVTTSTASADLGLTNGNSNGQPSPEEIVAALQAAAQAKVQKVQDLTSAVQAAAEAKVAKINGLIPPTQETVDELARLAQAKVQALASKGSSTVEDLQAIVNQIVAHVCGQNNNNSGVQLAGASSLPPLTLPSPPCPSPPA